MADISASTPVVAPAVDSITYDQWFMTQLAGRFTPEKALVNVSLRRSASTNAGTVLMPMNSKEDNTVVSFSLDVWKEMTNTPEIAAAINAVLTGVVAYATKNNLL